jgi:sugar phosphate permease
MALPGRQPSFWVAFGVTYALYGLSYAARSASSVAKRPLSVDLGLTDGDLGTLDAFFLGAYVVATGVVSPLLDLHDSWRVLDLCILFVGLANGLVAATDEVPHGTPVGLLVWARLCGAYALHGAAQALVYPAALSVLRAAATGRVSATALAVWSSASATGGLLGRWLARQCVQRSAFGWRAVFALPALLHVALGCGLPMLRRPGARRAAPAPAPTTIPPVVSRWSGLSPPVVTIGILYGCAKCVRYAFALWLPFFQGQAGAAATLFDIGNLGGSLIGGALADAAPGGPAYSVRPLAAACFATLCLLLPLLGSSSLSSAMHAHAMLLVGAAAGAAETLCGPVATAMLAAGSIPEGEGEVRTPSTGAVAGVINTLGALGGLAAAPLPARLGGDWGALCGALGAMCGTAAVVAVTGMRGSGARRKGTKTD